MCDVPLGSLVFVLKGNRFQGKSDDPPFFASIQKKVWIFDWKVLSARVCSHLPWCCLLHLEYLFIHAAFPFPCISSCFEVYTLLVHTITWYCIHIPNLGIRLAGLPGKENKSDLWSNNQTNKPRGQTELTFPSHTIYCSPGTFACKRSSSFANAIPEQEPCKSQVQLARMIPSPTIHMNPIRTDVITLYIY